MSDIAFEDGHRVPVQWFDHEALDVEIISRDREKFRKEMWAETWMALSSFVEMMVSDPKPRLVADCFRFAIQDTTLSECDIAKKFHVTKAAVSKRVVHITQILNIPPSRGMRSLEARETFSAKQKQLHADKRSASAEASARQAEGKTKNEQ